MKDAEKVERVARAMSIAALQAGMEESGKVNMPEAHLGWMATLYAIESLIYTILHHDDSLDIDNASVLIDELTRILNNVKAGKATVVGG